MNTTPSATGADADAIFSDALAHHQAGRLREAQAGYRSALQAKADHAPSLHYLGLLAHQVGQNDLAVSLISRAVAADRGNALYAYNLGEAYRALEKFEQAVANYRQALALDPELADAHFALGNALYEQKRVEEAIAAYRRAVELTPDDPEAWSNLGNALMDRKAQDEAGECYRRAIKADPSYLPAYINLGTVLIGAKRHDEAVALFRGVLARDEQVPEGHYNLGNALFALHKIDEAVASYQRALSLRPGFAEAHNALGLALQKRNDPSSATESFLKAIALKKDYVEAHTNLGSALVDLRRFDDALGALNEALRINPSHAEAHNQIASTLSLIGRIDEAIASARRALDAKPDFAEAHYMMGVLVEQQGKFDEAVEWQRKALALDPTLSEAHYHMTLSGRATKEGTGTAEMERLLETGNLDGRQRANLHFALGNAADHASDYERAFEHFRAANDLKKAEASFDEGGVAPYVDALIDAFDADYFAARQNIGSHSELPVFVLGMPRSGTTLAEQIIASHPRAFGAGELEHMGQLTSSLPELLQTPVPYPKAAELIDATNAKRVADHYLTALRERAPKADRIVDKMPLNFLRVGLIAALLPNARIIHTRRDPMDTCVSCYFQHFARGFHFSYDLANLGLYYREYERLMAHWHKVLPGRILDVQYETLIADQEAGIREIIGFCGLDWDSRCLAFHETDRQVRTASFWQVRQPLYASSVGRWRHYEKHLGPLKAALGRT